ncbi:thioesterase family protein [Qipengyuania aurantiaca]|uniref:Thioesterase family protein n=1 Tax=Qipengyuania aurantiaca TaxID=2867233 RepID=A0ABX8ZJB2_9SPHN|nr:acyl-CoA thioesterase domain-containing protein [Qipengyuania aurantiaca]QZD89105.1 thioesterase family protein [Qipengyuania aurantiaca]
MSDTKTPEQLVAGLIRLLTVAPAGEYAFTGNQQPGGIGRVFGGQVIAQALQAAQASAPEGMEAHSLHAYFLRGGREGVDIDYAVAADFTGRSFANRRVVARQAGEDGEGTPILNLTASFQHPEEGLEHEDSPMPDVPPPEDLPSDMEMRKKFLEKMGEVPEVQRTLMLRPRPIEMRTSGKLHWMNAEKKPPHAHSWFRAAAALPDDPALHRAVIAYASDFTLLGTSALPHGLSWARGELKGASLDHAIWFHRPARADEWLLYATDSPWSGGGRGFNRGRIFNRAGDLVASVAQEGVVRRSKRT